jgi:hypothetical protein
MKLAALLAACVLTISSSTSMAADWSPEEWVGEDTLQFRTECPDEGEHWSYVWVVVLDGDAWVRLGSKAAERVDCSKTKPMTTIRIAGHEFANVELVEVPDMAQRVADAMAAKYSTDFLVRYFDHPYTMKLVPKKAPEQAAAVQ